jgi:hypothetical protein
MTNGVKIFIIIILLLIVAIAAFVGYKGITDPAPAVCDPECKWYQECTPQTDGTPVCTLKSYDGFEVKDNKTTNDNSYKVVTTDGNFESDCVDACRGEKDSCKFVVVDTAGKKCWLKDVENPELIAPTKTEDTRVTFLKI